MRRVIKHIVTTITITAWTITWLEDEPPTNDSLALDQPKAQPPTQTPTMQPEAARKMETHHEYNSTTDQDRLGNAADAPARGL